MIIKQETIKHFADKGVSVRWYAEPTYEEFSKRIWQKDYDYIINYSKDNVRGSEATEKGRTNVLYETFAELEERAKFYADMWNDRHCRPYEYDRLFIEYDGKTIVKKENVKSKEITIEYIQKAIDKNEKAYSGYYGEFAKNMQLLLKENGINGLFSIYPTTYGIGVWVFYNWCAEKEISSVRKILDDRGIEYYNEYSEAGWVYRYKVSKRAENIQKITKL